MKIAGFHSGHECSYCVLEDGIPILHAELERYIREKEPFGDGYDLIKKDYDDFENIDHFASTLCTWRGGLIKRHPESYRDMWKHLSKKDGNFYIPGHHEAHAAAAFFSSNLEDALIVTIDGGGREYHNEDIVTATMTAYEGRGNKIQKLALINDAQCNIGAFWSSVTRDVMGLSVGHPKGHQAGTVMAMAAFGDPEKYGRKFLELRLIPWRFDFKSIKAETEQDKFDVAAGLQYATEIILNSFIGQLLESFPNRNLCLSGGVALNSVWTGKLLDNFNFENIYIDPVPYDGGLSIGSAQWAYHQILDKPRVYVADNFSSYLGKEYDKEDIEIAIDHPNLKHRECSLDELCTILGNADIVAVFSGKSESGRRALGNRSILADPRVFNMKDILNERVKHRAWFRPFAPSILREEVGNWFTKDISSPYMSFVLQFKEEMKKKVPSVVHEDGSARLQTVTKNDNPWYHEFLTKWHAYSGVPIILNTSFNDSEPIVETPYDAVGTFMKTNIDYLYFVDTKTLVWKEND